MTFLARCLSICLLALFNLPGIAADLPALSHMVAGGDSEYEVKPGDFLIAIGARFGVPAKILARENKIPYEAIIRPGQKLHIHNPHIVPVETRDGILINLPQLLLFLFQQGKLVAAYPVGLGKSTWPTPEGKFRIVTREINKTWKVPKSIQEEMRREQKIVQEELPPGPENPLGDHWLGLSMWGYGIHGTIAPSSIYHFRSHGCIRLHPDDVADLFQRVKISTPGRIIYQPVLMAQLEDGQVLLEVHQDVYNKGIDPEQTVRDMVEANGLDQAIDWELAEKVIAAQDGLAEEVGSANMKEQQ